MCSFFLSNNHTLSQVFDQNLATPAARDTRLAHMRDVIAGYLASGARANASKEEEAACAS